MAPEAIHPPALSHQCDLTRAKLQLSTMRMATLGSSLPVAAESPPDPPTAVSPSPLFNFPMLRNLRMFLWGACHRVLRHFWAAKELFSHTRFWLFLCSGHRAAAGMKGDAEKKTIDGRGEEGPARAEEVGRREQVSGSMSGSQRQVDKDSLKRRCMQVELEENWEESTDEEEEEEEYHGGDQLEEEEEEESECDWVEWDSEDEEEEKDEDEDVHQQSRPRAACTAAPVSLSSKQPSQEVKTEGESDDEEEEEDDDDDSDSDWSDDEDDSETSVESVELWESFLHSDDPYNPLSFSSSTHTSPAKTPDATHTSSSREQRRADEQQEEEKQEDQQHSSHNIKQHKKVCFSEEVLVRPLVAWAFASRAARDGSCWMQMARDRHRFRRRVEEAGRVIGPCLSPKHRCLVWERLQNSAL